MTTPPQTLFGNKPDKLPVLVSLCWTGKPCRYHGRARSRQSLLDRLEKKYELVFVCPELLAGMAVPRPAAPLRRKFGLKISNIKGQDLSAQFIDGAEKALAIAQDKGCLKAFLCRGSPSCDVNGFTGELLRKNGIEVKNY